MSASFSIRDVLVADPESMIGLERHVDIVIVGGRVLVEDRRIKTFDAEPVIAAMRGLVPRLPVRNCALRGWTIRQEELVG